MIKKCWCGKVIPNVDSRKYCSPGHKYQPKKLPPTDCLTCGKELDRKVGQGGRKPHYCSDECRRQPSRSSMISDDEYDKKFQLQKGLCAICGQPERAVSKLGKIKKLAFDHCHKTGKGRKLLCQQCNTGLGMFNDNVLLLIAAIEYLTE